MHHCTVVQHSSSILYILQTALVSVGFRSPSEVVQGLSGLMDALILENLAVRNHVRDYPLNLPLPLLPSLLCSPGKLRTQRQRWWTRHPRKPRTPWPPRTCWTWWSTSDLCFSPQSLSFKPSVNLSSARHCCLSLELMSLSLCVCVRGCLRVCVCCVYVCVHVLCFSLRTLLLRWLEALMRRLEELRWVWCRDPWWEDGHDTHRHTHNTHPAYWTDNHLPIWNFFSTQWSKGNIASFHVSLVWNMFRNSHTFVMKYLSKILSLSKMLW